MAQGVAGNGKETGRSPPSQQAPVAGKTNWQVLKEKVQERLRVAHYSYRTEQTYVGWIRQFVMFQDIFDDIMWMNNTCRGR